MKIETIQKLITFQEQIRIFHWQTKKYSRHMAYGSIYESFSDLIDKFVEVCMGKYDRFVIDDKLDITVQDIEKADMNEFIGNFISFLSNDISSEYVKDTDLLNIKDEMLGEIHKLKYLLTLS